MFFLLLKYEVSDPYGYDVISVREAEMGEKPILKLIICKTRYVSKNVYQDYIYTLIIDCESN